MNFVYLVLGSTSLVSIFLYINTRKRLVALVNGFQKLYEANQILKSLVDDAPTKEEEDTHKENFIKFLSDSREWAYEYIESVQVGIKEFIENVEPSIKHFNEFGIVVEGSPHYGSMKIISAEFEKLKTLLPEEFSDRR
jgi:hypothetical protein